MLSTYQPSKCPEADGTTRIVRLADSDKIQNKPLVSFGRRTSRPDQVSLNCGLMPLWRNGRRSRFKICWGVKSRVGSSPTSGIFSILCLVFLLLCRRRMSDGAITLFPRPYQLSSTLPTFLDFTNFPCHYQNLCKFFDDQTTAGLRIVFLVWSVIPSSVSFIRTQST